MFNLCFAEANKLNLCVISLFNNLLYLCLIILYKNKNLYTRSILKPACRAGLSLPIVQSLFSFFLLDKLLLILYILSLRHWKSTRVLCERCNSEFVQTEVLPHLWIWTQQTKSTLKFTQILSDNMLLTQFILDCCSLNLDNGFRVNINDPAAPDIYRTCRQILSVIHAERMRCLSNLVKNKKMPWF